jgi:hypothetical protein
LLVLLLVLGAVVGFGWGVQAGSHHGTAGAVIGGIVGLLVGVVAAALVAFLVALVSAPLARFGRWWRPYPPVCRNGTCIGVGHYEIQETADGLRTRVEGLSNICWRCRCGDLYAGGYAGGLQNPWVHLLSDETIRPYLRHGLFGRWKSDDGTDRLGRTIP